jgi:hypothetical protein
VRRVAGGLHGAALMGRRAVVASLGLLVGVGCANPCLDPSFAREARGSSDYVIDGRLHGLGPRRFFVRGYNPFAGGRCTDATSFVMLDVEVGPSCRLTGRVVSHRFDGGKYATGAFLQAEALVLDDQPCALSLDDGRTFKGRVESGSILLLPSSANVTLALRVEDAERGRVPMRLTMTGSWWPVQPERTRPVACASQQNVMSDMKSSMQNSTM